MPEAQPPARRPGLLRTAWTVAAKDLRIEGKTLERLAAMLVFALVVLVVASFAFDLTTVKSLGASKMIPGVLWITFTFAGIIGFNRSFQIEQRGGALVALMLAPVDRGAIYIGKLVSNLLTLWLTQAVVTTLSAVFFDYDLLSIALPLALVIALHTIGLTELGTLFAALTAKLGRGEALLGTLLLPASTPLFLSAVRCSESVFDGAGLGDVALWLGLVSGLNILYLLISLLTFDYLLEE